MWSFKSSFYSLVLFASKYLYFTATLLCLLYLIGFPKKGKTYRIFTFYIIGVLLIDIIASNLWKWFKIYNIFIHHFYVLFQFVMLSYFYSTLLQTKKQLLTVYILLIFLPIFLLSRYLFNPQMFLEYSLLEMYLGTMPIIIYATMHLYNNLGKQKDFYYANLGILLYLFASTFIFLFYELFTVLETNNTILNNLGVINKVLQYLKFGFFFYLWKLIYFNKDEKHN